MTATTDQMLVDDIVQTREELRAAARASLGVTGDASTADVGELRSRYGMAFYPLVALALLAVVDQFQTYAFTVLTPDISRALGLSLGVIAGVIALKTLAILVAPLPMAWLSQARSRRALLCVATGLAWSVMTLFTGFVTSLIALIVVLVVDGLTTGSVIALHQPLLMDTYPPEARVRALSFYRSAWYLGNVGSPLLVALLAGIAGFTWRGVFLAMGLLSIGMTLCCLGLRDPGFGRWDTDQVRAKVHEASGDDDATVLTEDVELGFWEICRRLLLIPTWRRVFAGYAVFGLLTVPLQTFLSFFLEQRWNLGPASRGLFFAYISGAAVLGLLLYGRRGEAQFRSSPARVPRSVGLFLGFGVALIAAGGLSPSFGLMAGLMGLGFLMFGPLNVGLAISGLSVIPSRMRPHAEALGGIFIAIGGVVGALFFSGISRRYGIAGSMVSVAVPGIAAAWIIASAGKYIGPDLDRMIDEILEDTEIKRIRASGGHLPMLACRGVDFSYGQLQVLFDVDFTVDDGEMVALLGVNGAGKSTLLKVISGIGLPSAGSVRFRGEDMTYLDAERRLKLGITQIPGGRAVFGPMTVTENLRSFGYTMRRDRRALERAIDHTFEAFPRLAQRRNSLASTLSGGEQQMLGLAKALILRPRLLLIDELSLGLAPVIVGQLLDMVRTINERGTAVVLVEQSVNIALNLVEHAYFMEKGEMRFDGRSSELLGRDDLLRAVFLHGSVAAGAGVGP